MKKEDIISVKEIGKERILDILREAEKMKSQPSKPILNGYLMASCFYEPSTRTRLSFESAMKRLGGDVIGFSGAAGTAVEKGEKLSDSIKIIGMYADVLVIRHPLDGAAKLAAESTDKPVINAGDGTNEHPTQTLVDLFSIQESQGKLEGLKIACVGDLLHGRTVHSLVQALKYFDPRLYFVPPPSLSVPEAICQDLRQSGIPFSFHESVEEIVDKVDILYMTRIQKERFSNPEEYYRVKDHFILQEGELNRAKETMRILHPLPRLNEIPNSIDKTPHAFYFNQAENGIHVRKALLSKVLGK